MTQTARSRSGGSALPLVGDYLREQRPKGIGTDRVFVTLKGPNRGRPMTADGVDKIFQAARTRAGLERATCHQLRHTCAMRLLAAGVDVTVIALWRGHESVETTQIYLHADLTIKERAIARTTPTGTNPGRYQPPDQLLAFLEAL